MPTLEFTRRRFRRMMVVAAGAVALSFGFTAKSVRGAADEPPKDKSQQRQAADKDKPAGAPGTLVDPSGKPAEEKAKPAAQISDDAKAVLDQVRDAYHKLDAVQMKGTWNAEFDVEGEKGKQNAEFTSSFQAPNKYRHETKDDILFGSTGEKMYVYSPDANRYLTKDAPKDRAAAGDLPAPFGQILREKNPALLLAVTSDESPLVTEGVTKVEKLDDVKLEGDKSYTALRMTTDEDASVKVLIDPQTHLVRQWSFDMKPLLEKRGREKVNKAQLTVDYADVKTGDAAKPAGEAAFAWAPPQGAKDAAEVAAAKEENPAAALEGKAAPDFTLEGMDGKPVKLADLKGSVVVLDFWATWCPPCRKGLPHLDKLYQANKGKGLKAFAVDLKETKDEVKQFVEQTKLGVPVLLDTDGKVAESYKVSGIPQTVVIGKDGKVQTVIVGFGDGDDRLDKALEKAMKDQVSQAR
jgi:peroxiredoxin